MKHCLNCGKELKENDGYCPGCGQDASTSRLSTRSFLMDTLLRLTRLNKGFIYTCIQLLLRPWTVIRDYIHGKRMKYTAPAQMLIVLCFIFVVFSKIVYGKDSGDLMDLILPSENSTKIRTFNYFLKFYLSSPSLQYIFLFLPALPVLRLVFKNHGADKYNTAEYLVAGLYMADTLLCLSILTVPVSTYLPELTSVLFLTLCTISVYKAFLSNKVSRWYRTRMILLYLFITFFLYVFLLTLLGLIYYLLIR